MYELNCTPAAGDLGERSHRGPVPQQGHSHTPRDSEVLPSIPGAWPAADPAICHWKQQSLRKAFQDATKEHFVTINYLHFDVLSFLAFFYCKHQVVTLQQKQCLGALSSVQFSSVAQSLRDPVNRSMPGLPVHHKLQEFTHTHVHRAEVPGTTSSEAFLLS